MACRRLVLQGRELLLRAAADGLGQPTSLLQRSAFSTLPDDLAAAAARARFPVRRPLQPSAAAEAAAAEAAAAATPAAATAAQQAAAKQVQVGTFRCCAASIGIAAAVGVSLPALVHPSMLRPAVTRPGDDRRCLFLFSYLPPTNPQQARPGCFPGRSASCREAT